MPSALDENARALVQRLAPNQVRKERAYAKTPTSIAPVRARLDANEAPYAIPTKIWQQAVRTLDATTVQRYPALDETLFCLRENLENLWFGSVRRAPTNPWIFGVGSDELIVLLLSAFTRTTKKADVPKILIPTPTFSMFALLARTRGYAVCEVPLNDAFDLDADAMVRALKRERPNVVFLASPNNPTGNAFSDAAMDAVIDVAETTRTLVVVDEAYVYYNPHGSRVQRWQRPHIVFMSTLSKIGMAGLRLGFMQLAPELAHEVDKLRLPYNVPSPSAHLALALLQNDCSWLERNRKRVETGRRELATLAADFGFRAHPSDSNIVLYEGPFHGAELAGALRNHGVLVRAFSNKRLRKTIRVNVGTPAEHRILRDALQTWQRSKVGRSKR